MAEIPTVDGVVEALGGGSAVSRLIEGCTPQRVSNWKAGGYFPPQTYSALKAALAKRGHDAPDSLWRMSKSTEALEALRQGIG